MNFYEFVLRFAGEHPFTAGVVCLGIAASLYKLVSIPAYVAKRRARSQAIAAHGWPPPHVDADGDLKGD